MPGPFGWNLFCDLDACRPLKDIGCRKNEFSSCQAFQEARFFCNVFVQNIDHYFIVIMSAMNWEMPATGKVIPFS